MQYQPSDDYQPDLRKAIERLRESERIITDQKKEIARLRSERQLQRQTADTDLLPAVLA